MFLLEKKRNVIFRVTQKTNIKSDLKYHYNIHYSNSLSLEYSIIGMFYYPYNMFHIMCVYSLHRIYLLLLFILLYLFLLSKISKLTVKTKSLSVFQYEYLHRNRSRKYNNFMEMETDRVTRLEQNVKILKEWKNIILNFKFLWKIIRIL